MKLQSSVSDFICRFWRKFTERVFIIDTMTDVANRPLFQVYDHEFPTETKKSVEISFLDKPENAKYSPPYNLEEIKKNYSEEIAVRIMSEPIHKWRAESGIELIHKEPDLGEQIRTYRNWLLMTDEQKKTSDEMSVKFFGMTNEEHFKSIMLHEYVPETIIGSVWMMINEKEDRFCLVYISELTDSKIVLNYLSNGTGRVMGETDTFTLQKGILNCYSDNETIETTVGRFLLNVLLVELPFDGKFKYVNKPGFDIKGIESFISEALLSDAITVSAYKQYVDNIYFIGHFCELCVPTMSKAALTTSPDMEKLKKELLEKYKDKLDDPKVIAEIEDALIAADKSYLKDDSSMRFYTPLGDKPFNIARKKMYLMVGGIEAFSKDSGKYDFIQSSLSDGWKNSDVSTFANETRKGSFNRGHETQLGGAQTKYIVRVFQDLKIAEDDCHSTRGLEVDFAIHDPKEFKGRYVNIHGTWTKITSENLEKIKGQKYIMRSPMYCRCKTGLCKKCAGEIFANLDVKYISMYIADISSTFMMISMKLMHGSKLSVYELGDLNSYIV